jgi:hypothetical protein
MVEEKVIFVFLLNFFLVFMGLLDSIVAGVVTTVISALVLEAIREAKTKGTQPLEKLAGLIVKALEATGKTIWSVIRWVRDALNV